LQQGALEAVKTVCVLTTDNAIACDMLREYGAVPHLVELIDTDSKQHAAGSNEPPRSGPLLSEPAAKWGLGAGYVATRPHIVPAASKTFAVSTLHKVAAAGDVNLDAIISQPTIITTLVHLMTKMEKDEPENLCSPFSRDKSPEPREKMDDAQKEKLAVEVRERRQLTQDNLRLAEKAGEMVHQLIIDGENVVKKMIISAIVEKVQQPGTSPPVGVPALVEILRSTAMEQLSLVRCGSDEEALQAALSFGRWIKLPMLLLGEARNQFKQLAASREKTQRRQRRRVEMGLKVLGDEEPLATIDEEPMVNELAEPSRPTSPISPFKYNISPISPTNEPFSRPDGTYRGSSAKKQQPSQEAASTSNAPQRSQRGVPRSGHKTAIKRRDRFSGERVKKLKELKSDSDAARETLLATKDGYQRQIVEASPRRAENRALDEADALFRSGSHAAAKHPAMCFEREAWTPQLGSIAESSNSPQSVRRSDFGSPSSDHGFQRPRRPLGNTPRQASGNILAPHLKSFEVPGYMLPHATKPPLSGLRGSRGSSGGPTPTDTDRSANAHAAARALMAR